MKKYEKEEEEEIQRYLLSNPDLSFKLKSSGLYYCDVVVGTGIHPETGDTAYMMFTAIYLSGDTLGTNVGTTDTLINPVNEGYRILGFDEAITYMNQGGKSKFIVPSYLGYGNSGLYFPAYTPIVFEVDLVRVKLRPGAR
jgi:FKBP-type peptidyl-prolyl cis-trans isomerase